VTVKVAEDTPPQAVGIPVFIFVKTPLHPPVNEAVASQALNLACITSVDWQASSVTFVGQFKVTTGAFVTVNVALHVRVVSQVEVTVQVTVFDPPQASGAPVLLFVKTASQPPLAVAELNHASYFESMAAWVWQAASVTLDGHVKTTGGALLTVNVAVHVFGASQSDVAVNVTVRTPPHAGGAPVLLLVKLTLHPPEYDAVANQSLYFVSIEACDWHATSVVFDGHVKTTDVASTTVKVAEQVLGASQSDVTVQVTVFVPPQAEGAPVLLLVNTGLQPPEVVVSDNQLLYFVLI